MTAIVGEYVTFGVFELYGDKALDDALDIAMKMILSVPLTDLLAYKKVRVDVLLCCIKFSDFLFSPFFPPLTSF